MSRNSESSTAPVNSPGLRANVIGLAGAVTLGVVMLSPAMTLYGGFGPFWAVALDLTPGWMRGAFTGFVNMGGQIGGFLAPIVVGTLVTRTHSFADGFLFMMAALILAAVCLLRLQQTELSGAGGR